MSYIVSILVLLTVFSVAAILIAGLINMSRNGSISISQKLMRWRVGVQFVAVCLIMASLYLSGA